MIGDGLYVYYVPFSFSVLPDQRRNIRPTRHDIGASSLDHASSTPPGSLFEGEGAVTLVTAHLIAKSFDYLEYDDEHSIKMAHSHQLDGTIPTLPANSSGNDHPIMHSLSSLLLLGTSVYQAVLGRPDASRVRYQGDVIRRSVDSFVATESPIAVSRLLCNLGPDGCYANGVAAGAVIASPSKNNPDYWYTWTRDSALTFKEVVDTFEGSYNTTLQTEIENYITAQAYLQGLSNPSGSLSDGTGLGEPKFNVDLTAFTDSWGKF